jgi:hypothetical protein
LLSAEVANPYIYGWHYRNFSQTEAAQSASPEQPQKGAKILRSAVKVVPGVTVYPVVSFDADKAGEFIVLTAAQSPAPHTAHFLPGGL